MPKAGEGWVLLEAGEIKAYLVAAKDAGKDILIVNDLPAGRMKLTASEADSACCLSLGDGKPLPAAYPAAVAADFPAKLEVKQGLMIRVNNRRLRDRLPQTNVSELFHGISKGDCGTSKLVSWGIDDY